MNSSTRSHLWLFLMTVFLTGCKEPSKENYIQGEKISFPLALKNSKKDVLLSSIADRVEYIKLETNEACIIDKIEKLVLYQDNIFIANATQFFKFSKDGEFIKRIGTIGKGPGEYIKIMDFAINSKKKVVSIYDIDLRKIINYDLEGNYLEEFLLDSQPTLIAYDKSNRLNAAWVLPDFFYNNQFNFSIYDTLGQVSEQFYDRKNIGITAENASLIPSTSRTRFEYFNDSLSFWEINLPYIGRIKDGQFIPRFNLAQDFKPELLERNSTNIVADQFIFSDLIETSRYIFFTKGIYQNDAWHIIYDKLTKNINSFNLTHTSPNVRLNGGFLNDIDGGYPFLPKGLASKDEAYCVFYAYELLDLLQEEPFSKITKTSMDGGKAKLLELVENATLQDNPIVMIAKFKSL